jgi:hypothetical protein
MAGMTTRLQPSARAYAVLLLPAVGIGPVPGKPKAGPIAGRPGF